MMAPGRNTLRLPYEVPNDQASSLLQIAVAISFFKIYSRPVVLDNVDRKLSFLGRSPPATSVSALRPFVHWGKSTQLLYHHIIYYLKYVFCCSSTCPQHISFRVSRILDQLLIFGPQIKQAYGRGAMRALMAPRMVKVHWTPRFS
jgi:hypothetical protein